MHMSDALLSPAVGAVMYAASAAAIGFSVKKINDDKFDEKKIPIMGIMGAFIFAGQMVNFTIPGTGSSGHIVGGVLLAAMLGPYAALITLTGVLIVQCLFFADGGLLALGANIFNMGVTSCLFAYFLIFRPITRKTMSRTAVMLASILSAIAGLQAGAFGVVLETLFSGVTELPFGIFVMFMQPIHLAIGLVEGIVTAAALCFVQSARPELIGSSLNNERIAKNVSMKRVIIVFAALAVTAGGVFSIFASKFPDGLEWSMEKTSGTDGLEREGGIYAAAEKAAETTAFMPDYASKKAAEAPEARPGETSQAGIIGSVITLVLCAAAAFIASAAGKRARRKHA